MGDIQQVEQNGRSAPLGVDLLQTLMARLAGLEARMLEVERCKHDSHSIGNEALEQIAQHVMGRIAQAMLSSAPTPQEKTEE